MLKLKAAVLDEAVRTSVIFSAYVYNGAHASSTSLSNYWDCKNTYIIQTTAKHILFTQKIAYKHKGPSLSEDTLSLFRF